MKPKLLITGSAGLIGGILWEGLFDSYELYGLDNHADTGKENRFQADITQEGQVQSVMDRIPDLRYLIHLAGDPRVDADWQSTFNVNIGGTANVYAQAQQHGVQRIVYASSNHVTGAYEGFPPSRHTKEDVGMVRVSDPIRPDGFYGVSKASGEAIARMYYELYGLESICLRIGSVTQDDDPGGNPRMRSTWLSHRDLIQLVLCSLQADVKFCIYYGVSNNKKRFWYIADAEREISYKPEDDGSRGKAEG